MSDISIGKRLDLVNELIDRMINNEGIEYTIGFLVDAGFSAAELVELGFDMSTIVQIIAEKESIETILKELKEQRALEMITLQDSMKEGFLFNEGVSTYVIVEAGVRLFILDMTISNIENYMGNSLELNPEDLSDFYSEIKEVAGALYDNLYEQVRIQKWRNRIPTRLF